MGLLAYFRGEALRLRRGEEDLQGAIASYQAATRHPDAPVAVWRELGDASRRAGDTAGAVAALSRYVDLAPNAQDRWLVETTLKTLKQGLGT